MTDEQKVEPAKVEVPAKFEKLVGEVEKLTIVELAELVKVLENKFGVTAAAPVSMAPGGAAGAHRSRSMCRR